MQADSKPRRSPEATYQPVGEEAILINLTSGTYYSLNDTGTMFWELLDGQRTIIDCARLVAADYDVDAGVVETDLLELATDLEHEGLIVV